MGEDKHAYFVLPVKSPVIKDCRLDKTATVNAFVVGGIEPVITLGSLLF